MTPPVYSNVHKAQRIAAVSRRVSLAERGAAYIASYLGLGRPLAGPPAHGHLVLPARPLRDLRRLVLEVLQLLLHQEDRQGRRGRGHGRVPLQVELGTLRNIFADFYRVFVMLLLWIHFGVGLSKHFLLCTRYSWQFLFTMRAVSWRK